MKRTILTITILLTSLACDAPDEDLRSLEIDAVELRTPGEHLDYWTDPAEQILCCANPGGCYEPHADGTCPNGTIATCCSDFLTCSEGACWHECGPNFCPGNS